MSTLLPPAVHSGASAGPFVWERQLRPAVDAVIADEAGAPRAVVMGNAGSGKTALLHHLRRLLTDVERPVTMLSGGDADVARVPHDHALLVDDLHLMSRRHIEHILARAEDPDASLVVASRPWPATRELTGIAHHLERTRPAIVLGHVSRSDVLTYLAQQDQPMPSTCVEHILAMTGGVSWLVTEALRAHDERDCVGDPSHTELARILGEQISYRLDRLDAPLRRAIESMCLAAPRQARSLSESGDDADVVLRAYAEGLVLRGGQPVPVVRTTVRATVPVRTLVELSAQLADGLADATATGDDVREWLGLVRDPDVAAALAREGDQLLATDPARAAELYRTAIECGARAEDLAARRARAAFATGGLDEAALLVDGQASPSIRPTATRRDEASRLADVAAATWAARSLMGHAHETYAAAGDLEPESAVRARATAYAVGEPDAAPAVSEEPSAPSTLRVAMRLLDSGLRASMTGDGADALVSLVRAAEMYTASATTAPIPELPAVVAAGAAIGLGDLETAQTVIEDAAARGHGGAWARPRLLLWQAWIAVQRGRPADARALLARAVEDRDALSPRDELVAQTVRVAIARRYEDAAEHAAAWHRARPHLLRADMDLFLLPLLTELVCSGAKLGEPDVMRTPFAEAVDLVTRLGSPPVWAAHVHWAGIQQGILLSTPDRLPPHAHALVAAGAHSRVAAAMARAGRVWTSVLAGTVDAEAIDAAARGLADVGLAWDGARLAGHGAGRTDDRRIAARLLACARELHPTDAARKPSSNGDAPPPGPEAAQLLSERELDVARLVVEGKTYAEIGAAIFISPRTAEHHIAHIRRRLDATSRSDMIAKLRVLLAQTDATSAASAHTGSPTDQPP